MLVYVVNDINSVQIFHSLVLLIQVSALEHTLMTSPILLFDIFMKLVLLISLPSCFLTSVSLAQHFLHIRLMSLVHLFWWYVDIHFTYGFGEHPSDPAVGNTLVFIFSFPCYFQASQNPPSSLSQAFPQSHYSLSNIHTLKYCFVHEIMGLNPGSNFWLRRIFLRCLWGSLEIWSLCPMPRSQQIACRSVESDQVFLFGKPKIKYSEADPVTKRKSKTLVVQTS